MSKEEVGVISEKLKVNIKLLQEMGFNKITLNDYYTSTMKIVKDLLSESKE